MPLPDYTEQPDIHDLMGKLAESSPYEWKHFEIGNRNPGTAQAADEPIPAPGESDLIFVYAQNPDLRIERTRRHEVTNGFPEYVEPFQEKSIYDDTVHSVEYTYYHGVSPIDTVAGYEVDGGRGIFIDIENVAKIDSYGGDYLSNRYQTVFSEIVVRPPGKASDLGRYYDEAGIETTDLIGFDEYYR